MFKTNPSLKVILLEPFTLPLADWVVQIREDLDPKIEIVNKIAKEYNLDLIPLDKIFKENAKIIAQERLSIDGIHPTILGHALIAEQIINKLMK